MTTEITTTIARPYAKAAFEYALAQNDLTAWENMLKTASMLAEDKSVAQMLMSPKVSMAQLADLFCDALKLEAEKKNFIRLLAENKRLSALPEIMTQFAMLRADHDKTMTVDVTSAVALTAEYQQKLIQALTKRLQRKVVLECTVDPLLIGGILVTAGDLALDGSVRDKLNRLSEFI